MKRVFVFLKTRARLEAGFSRIVKLYRIPPRVVSGLGAVRFFNQFKRWNDPIRVGVLGVKDEKEILTRVANVHRCEETAIFQNALVRARFYLDVEITKLAVLLLANDTVNLLVV